MNTNLFSGTPAKVNNNLKVLFVGRLVPEKGAHIAIEAINEMLKSGFQDVTLTIAGVPTYPLSYSEGLRKMVEDRGLKDKVFFLGTVPNQELPHFYRTHQVLAFPSAHLEGLPVTLLEAMACGTMIIGTITGGSAELLKNGINCLVIPKEDSTALANSLRQVIENPEQAYSLATAGQNLVREKFNLEKIVDQTEEYLQSVIY